jgi:hypothetical protein
MSTDTLTPRASVDTSVDGWTTEELETPSVPHEPRRQVQEALVGQPATDAPAAPTVAAATLAAHAIDRADARLERLCDELERLRGTTDPGADIDAEETRLMFAITQAEQSRRSLDA